MEPDLGALAWIVFIFVVPLVGVAMCWFARRRGRSHPVCPHCGYDLRGTLGRTGQCPECGTNVSRGRCLVRREMSRGWQWFYVAGFLVAAIGGVILLALPVMIALLQMTSE